MERERGQLKNFATSVTLSFLFHAAALTILLSLAGMAATGKPGVFMVELMELPSSIKNYTIAAATTLKRGEPIPQRTTPQQAATPEEPAQFQPPVTVDGPEITVRDAPPSAGAASDGSTTQGDGGTADKTTLSYFDAVRLKIERAKRYPTSARRAGVEGETTIAFTIKPDGSASAVEMEHSSGSGVLDRSAAETVLKAAPYPATPDGKPARIRVAIQFRTH